MITLSLLALFCSPTVQPSWRPAPSSTVTVAPTLQCVNARGVRSLCRCGPRCHERAAVVGVSAIPERISSRRPVTSPLQTSPRTRSTPRRETRAHAGATWSSLRPTDSSLAPDERRCADLQHQRQLGGL